MDKMGNPPLQPQSFFKKCKYFAIIGTVIGVFPAQNIFRAQNTGVLRVKRCSFINLFSWFSIIIKLVALSQAVTIVMVLVHTLKYKQRITDIIAQIGGFVLTFAFGLAAQIVLVFRTRKLIELLKAIDAYDDHYPCAIQTKFFSRTMIWYVLCSVCMILAPLFLMHTTLYYYDNFNPSVFVYFVSTKNKVAILMYFASAFFVVEYAVLFMYTEILYLSALMGHRLENIIQCIAGRSISSGKTNNPFLFEKVQPKYLENAVIYSGTMSRLNFGDSQSATRRLFAEFTSNRSHYTMPEYSSKSWSALSKQYIKFEDLFVKFVDFIGFYFIILYSTLMVSSVCLIYFGSNTDHPLAQDLDFLYLGVVLVGFFRIYTLAECGDRLERKHKRLLRILMQVHQDDNFFEDERKQFKRFLKLASTVNIRLSAGGFFFVNRQNLTSITSVIITYIIVLLQFRVSETSPPNEEVKSKNTTNWI